MAVPAVPTAAEAAARLNASEADPVFAGIYETAIAMQQRDCWTADYSHELREACFRRIANLWASKAHVLGVLDAGDFGVQYVPRYDPMLDQLEQPYRKDTTVIA